VRELGRSPPVDSNELFDITASFASGQKAVGAIFDDKKGKRVDDAPAEGSKSKEPQKKQKQGKKGKKPHRDTRTRDAMRTTMRPSQLTPHARALEQSLEASAYSMTC
jgi:hypothetical protein